MNMNMNSGQAGDNVEPMVIHDAKNAKWKAVFDDRINYTTIPTVSENSNTPINNNDNNNNNNSNNNNNNMKTDLDFDINSKPVAQSEESMYTSDSLLSPITPNQRDQEMEDEMFNNKNSSNDKDGEIENNKEPSLEYMEIETLLIDRLLNATTDSEREKILVTLKLIRNPTNNQGKDDISLLGVNENSNEVAVFDIRNEKNKSVPVIIIPSNKSERSNSSVSRSINNSKKSIKSTSTGSNVNSMSVHNDSMVAMPMMPPMTESNLKTHANIMNNNNKQNEYYDKSNIMHIRDIITDEHKSVSSLHSHGDSDVTVDASSVSTYCIYYLLFIIYYLLFIIL